MGSQRFWIVEGQRLPPGAAHELDENAERDRFERIGGVRVTTGALGTEIKWSAFSPCFASLYHVLNWLPEASKPFVLRYYLCGWFEEFVHSVEEARDRIEQILAKSDMRITKRAFVKEVDKQYASIPKIISSSINSGQIIPHVSIDCVMDERTQKFRVNRVGAQSLIARIYGIVPVTYPFVNGGSYDDIVCAAYKDVLDTGQPRYDHVLAAMRLPNNSIHWLPYHRWIVPKQGGASAPSVTVVTEIGNVDIKVV